MKAFKYLIFLSTFLFSTFSYSGFYSYFLESPDTTYGPYQSPQGACIRLNSRSNAVGDQCWALNINGDPVRQTGYWYGDGEHAGQGHQPAPKCEAGVLPVTLKVPVSSGKMVCVNSCQYSLTKCVDVDFESGMTCDGVNEGRECGTPPPTTTPTTPPVTQDPTNPTDKTDEQKTFENIMHVIGEKLDGIKDAITGGNQNQDGGDTGGSTGGNTGGDINVDMSETNAKIDETNSLIDELTKWLQGEDLGDDIFGDQEPPEKELTPQQLDTSIFSSRSQCPADARLSFNLLGGKSFTKTFEFKDWCDNLEIFGSLILIASYLFGAYIIVSKS
jgi:hypothetical protein